MKQVFWRIALVRLRSPSPPLRLAKFGLVLHGLPHHHRLHRSLQRPRAPERFLFLRRQRLPLRDRCEKRPHLCSPQHHERRHSNCCAQRREFLNLRLITHPRCPGRSRPSAQNPRLHRSNRPSAGSNLFRFPHRIAMLHLRRQHIHPHRSLQLDARHLRPLLHRHLGVYQCLPHQVPRGVEV